MKQIIVVDDFYLDPDLIRDIALKEDYTITGQFPALGVKGFRGQMY